MVSIRELYPFGDLDARVVGPAIRQIGPANGGVDLPAVASGLAFAAAAVDMLDTIPRPMTDAGLSPARWRLLVALRFQAGDEGATIGELADHLGVREPTVTASVSRAERDGHVVRARDEADRRVVRVRLTSQGDDALHDLLPVMAGRVSGFVERMGGSEQVREMTERVRRALATVRDHDQRENT